MTEDELYLTRDHRVFAHRDLLVEQLVDAVHQEYCNSFDPITDSGLPSEEAAENIIVTALETLLQNGLANPQGVQRVLQSFSTSEHEHDE